MNMLDSPSVSDQIRYKLSNTFELLHLSLSAIVKGTNSDLLFHIIYNKVSSENYYYY